ncbi:hypothetical protein ACVGOW_23505 [Pseudonocardia saturnea]
MEPLSDAMWPPGIACRSSVTLVGLVEDFPPQLPPGVRHAPVVQLDQQYPFVALPATAAAVVTRERLWPRSRAGGG